MCTKPVDGLCMVTRADGKRCTKQRLVGGYCRQHEKLLGGDKGHGAILKSIPVWVPSAVRGWFARPGLRLHGSLPGDLRSVSRRDHWAIPIVQSVFGLDAGRAALGRPFGVDSNFPERERMGTPSSPKDSCCQCAILQRLLRLWGPLLSLVAGVPITKGTCAL